MAYLDRKSGNNQQGISNGQSVEINTEAVEQLERLLNLLTDLNLISLPVKLTEKSIKSDEQKHLLITETNEMEKNHNSLHQNLIKDSVENDDDVIDVISYLVELTEEPIKNDEQKILLITDTNKVEDNHNSLHQNLIKDDDEVIDKIIFDTGKNYVFPSQTSNFSPRNLRNKFCCKSTIAPGSLKYNFYFLAELTEKYDEQKNFLITDTNEVEKNHNSLHHNLIKNDDEVIDTIIFDTGKNYVFPSQTSNLNPQNLRNKFCCQSTIYPAYFKYNFHFPGELTEKSDQQKNFLITETNETEKNQNPIKNSPKNKEKILDLENQSSDYQKEIPTREKPFFISSKSSEISGSHHKNYTELEAFEILQNILFGSQIAKLIRNVNTNLSEQKIHHLQDQSNNLSNPVLLENLLTYLCQTEGKNKEAISYALAPILSSALAIQIEQDEQSIIEVLAPLLPGLISYAIKNYPQEIAKAIGPEMGAAIREQAKIDRQQISQTLAPEMGEAIKEQVFLERNSIIDALYPVIGSTISKYMTETIREINHKISQTFGSKVIKRKIKATLQGVSEAEIMLSEINDFSVKAIFLIHKESGLVIAEAKQPGLEKLESEMVAGMLTAIRSFVNDCIVQSGDISELDEIEYGDSKIILEVAGHCYLAVVIKREPHKSYIKELRQTFSKIVIDYGQDIKNFSGDPETIPSSIKLQLKKLVNVEEKQKSSDSEPPTALLILCGIILSLMLIPWGIYHYSSRVNRSIEVKTINGWANIPRLAFYSLNAEVKRGYLVISGKLPNKNLRNQAIEIAEKEANFYNLKLDNQIIIIEVPPDPSEIRAELELITKALNQMKGVSITTKYTEDKVIVIGTVMDAVDAEKIIAKIEQVPGVKSVVTAIKLSPLTLNSRIYFELGSAKLQPAYTETIVQIKQFLSQHPTKYLKIIGYTDRTGGPDINQKLALERATIVRDALVKQGVDARRLIVTGKTSSPQDVEDNQPLLLSRCVVFELLEETAEDN
ncbi:OmpA family protein [Okeania sp.]|uniref:OmpA family protein n=1 Tax=Okeania sp. TaxID=3100323 RepID=UPI002B4B7AFE|nr:OmpA family protein [Okeania sp.]MEB3342015.1 OmpA family protein [Okeania sp.]